MGQGERSRPLLSEEEEEEELPPLGNEFGALSHTHERRAIPSSRKKEGAKLFSREGRGGEKRKKFL